MDYEVWELELLLKAARKSFQQGSSLAEFNAPVNICGDIHGQYSDLIRIFQVSRISGSYCRFFQIF